MAISFIWDSRKEQTNRRKHGVSFAEARTVFTDLAAKIFPDVEHSDNEVREILVGHSVAGRLLLVIFTESPSEQIRIISARETTRTERMDYEEAG